MIGSYIEAVCGINNIKISGSQQLATDIGYGRDAGDEGRYLSNVISAFGLGNASVLGVFKEVFALTDSGSKRKAVMKTRAVAEVEHRGNHFRRRGPHPPESGETAEHSAARNQFSIGYSNKQGTITQIACRSGHFFLRFTRWSWQRKQSWATDRRPPWQQVR